MFARSPGPGINALLSGPPVVTRCSIMSIIEDLVAEQDRIASVFLALDERDWRTPSLCAGWTICDVVLHLAQTEEAAASTVGRPILTPNRADSPRGVDDAAGRAVEAERDTPQAVFARWRRACHAFVTAFERADPEKPVQWVGGSLKPTTLATTRLAEHWAHGLDITAPLGAAFPDTNRLRSVAWLGHRTLPYAFRLAGLAPQDVYAELVAPEGGEMWTLGSPRAASSIRGDAGAFCRVGARRLAPAESGVVADGPHGETALRLLRNYAA